MFWRSVVLTGRSTKDIDLRINGQWWEVKSPNLGESRADNGEGLGFVGSNLPKGSEAVQEARPQRHQDRLQLKIPGYSR